MEVVCVPMGKHICKTTGYCAEGECMEEGRWVSYDVTFVDLMDGEGRDKSSEPIKCNKLCFL